MRRHSLLSLSTLSLALLTLLLSSCFRMPEMSREDIAFQRKQHENTILKETVYVPSTIPYEEGRSGGIYQTNIMDGMKTLNMANPLDGSTQDILGFLFPYLMDYDPNTKKWIPNIASAQLVEDPQNFIQERNLSQEEADIISKIPADGLGVIYTIRDDAKWYIPTTGETIDLTAEDPIFWYNEISGDSRFQDNGYAGQFMQMPDGEMKRIEAIQLTPKSFIFIFPQRMANPIYATSMNFGPSYIYKKAKKGFSDAEITEKKDIEAVKALFPMGSDTKLIPTAGPFYMEEYTKDVRIVMKKNPTYFKKDDWGNSLPYLDGIKYRFFKSEDAIFNEFKQGRKESIGVSAKKMDYFINLKKKNPNHFKIYSAGPSLSSGFITFNQNPANKDKPFYQWFIKKEFRQAMSSILNRQRIAETIYRGLAEPALDFFSKPNMMYNPEIKLKYTYNPQKAIQLLASIGITPNEEGNMTDPNNNIVKFEIMFQSDSESLSEIFTIFVDEAAKIGITITPRPVDFYMIVDSLTASYQWQSVNLAFTGSNAWPTAGSNVWQSNGNLHLWYPLQESPATAWEKRMDDLYNRGEKTIDREKAKVIWDEYQQIVLEQLPLIYMVQPHRFSAFDNRLGNVRYDSLNEKNWFASEIEYIYFKSEKEISGEQ